MKASTSRHTTATPAPASVLVSERSRLVQRKCSCGGVATATGKCHGCHRKRHTDAEEALRSPGQPLDAGTRALMESHFRHDFSAVRIHVDRAAEESARNLGALAYTVGCDVVFSAGSYSPSSHTGRRLVAHELAHVVQQCGADRAPAATLEIASPDSRAEQEAERAGREVGTARGVAPVVAGSIPAQVQRQTPPAPPPMQASPMTEDDGNALEAAQSARKDTLARATKALLDLERALRAIGPSRTSDPSQSQRLWQAYSPTIWPLMRWLKVEPGADLAAGKDAFLHAVTTARNDMQINQRTTAPVEKIDDATDLCGAEPSVQGFARVTGIRLCARAFAGGVGNLTETVMHETFHLLGGTHGGEVMRPGIPGCDLSPTPEAALLNPYCLTSLAYALSATPDVAAPRPVPIPQKPESAGGEKSAGIGLTLGGGEK